MQFVARALAGPLSQELYILLRSGAVSLEGVFKPLAPCSL
jgi:hypothetical protein